MQCIHAAQAAVQVEPPLLVTDKPKAALANVSSLNNHQYLKVLEQMSAFYICCQKIKE